MSRELWLLRHAKAKRGEHSEDFDRALKKCGKHDAQKLGEWLKQQQLIPDLIISSPAKRASSTANEVLKTLDADLNITEDNRLYAQGFEQLKNVLAECPAEAQRVLLVGHNPELEDLLIHLVGLTAIADRNKLLPTSALARLDMPDDWTQLSVESAQLIAITDLRTSED
jgi:phosphohistidine phosphatase